MRYRKLSLGTLASLLVGLFISNTVASQQNVEAVEVTAETTVSEDYGQNVNEAPPESIAKDHIESMYYSYAAEYHEKSLVNSGLSEHETYHLIDDIARGYADCIVDALRKTATEEAANAIKLTAEGAEGDEIFGYIRSVKKSPEGDAFRVYTYESDVCIDSVHTSYGISDF